MKFEKNQGSKYFWLKKHLKTSALKSNVGVISKNLPKMQAFCLKTEVETKDVEVFPL